MSRCRPIKKTFIIAALVILLCIISITGATFALFTSNENDGKIGINATAGNLSVDIVDLSDEQNTLVGEVLKFVPKEPKENILFEPGSVYYTEGFRVKNDGDVLIRYIIYISEDETTVAADFAEAFDVWITTNPTSRSDMVSMQEFEGKLYPTYESEPYYLVFRMKETADNKFQDREFTGVGITVCAVQGNVGIQ